MSQKTSNRENLVKIWFLWRIFSKLWIYILVIHVIANAYKFLLAVRTCQQHDSDTNNIFTWYSRMIRWICLKISITKH